jgi:hypothetical protein
VTPDGDNVAVMHRRLIGSRGGCIASFDAGDPRTGGLKTTLNTNFRTKLWPQLKGTDGCISRGKKETHQNL